MDRDDEGAVLGRRWGNTAFTKEARKPVVSIALGIRLVAEEERASSVISQPSIPVRKR